ncbi:MAG: hypothetical protein Q8L23_15820 [Caulobacter sp.]|nr:hypothetical protein [Caulobacter sp.]
MTGVVDERRRALARVTAGAGLAAKRAAFRDRWIAAGVDPVAAVEPDLDLLARLLGERIGEAVGDVEDGRDDLLAAALGEALALIDEMDDRLGHTEVWVRQLALRQGVDVLAARDAAKARRGTGGGG